MNNKLKIEINDLNEYIVCKLCKGYLIEPHTINECLHTFCKTCLVKYFNDSNNCPTCDIVIHPSYPLGKIIPDRLLEDIIDKILPNLYYSELERQREFWRKNSKKIPEELAAKLRNMRPKRRLNKSFEDDARIKTEATIDSKCLNFKQLFHKYLCISSNCNAYHVKKFIIDKMGIDENNFEVVLTHDNEHELKSRCPLLFLKNCYFENEEKIVLFYAIVDKGE